LGIYQRKFSWWILLWTLVSLHTKQNFNLLQGQYPFRRDFHCH